MKQLHKILKLYYAEWQTEPDITVVLKYISKNIWELRIVYENDVLHLNNYYIAETFVWYKRDREYLWNIPNKPFNLYTEEEKQQLLDLFAKLS